MIAWRFSCVVGFVPETVARELDRVTGQGVGGHRGPPRIARVALHRGGHAADVLGIDLDEREVPMGGAFVADERDPAEGHAVDVAHGVPELAVEPLSLAARNAHDESTDRRRMR